MDSKVKRDNYVLIQGWMLTDLHLSGNDLLVYAIIYGFSQSGDQDFHGSIQYLADWTNSTRQGITKNIDNLIEKGLIEKIEDKPTNRYRTTDYTVNSVTDTVNKVTTTVNTVTTDCKQSLQNNLDNNISNNINNNISTNDYEKQKDLNSKIETIIGYFNQVCSSKFRTTTSATKKLIKRHLAEGFTLDDFKNVIDIKYKDWGERPFRFSSGQMSNEYLRPTTLFGDKFETYVYEALTRLTSESFTSKSSEVDPDKSNYTF